MPKTNDSEMDRLFARAELRRACVMPPDARTRESLRRQCERGKACRPARGIYARASYWSALSQPQRMLHLLRTLQERHPDWVFCHESAALAHGLPIAHDRLGDIHVATSPTRRTGSSQSIRWHIANDDESTTVQGLRVTSLTRTVLDCMRTTDFKQALAVADGALRLTGMRPSTFVSRFKRIGRGLPGLDRAVRAMFYADACSESGGESIARAAMIEQGFALPQLQVAFQRPMDRGRIYRVDFLWTRMDGSKVIGEFDGMQKYESATMRGGRSALRVLADEQHRESQLSLYGMPIVRFSYEDVMDANRFARLLTCYGIPQSDEAARTQRRLARSKSPSAQIFAVCSLRD